MLVLLAGGIAATLWQARIARIERRLADERFFDTRQLANSLLFELHDAIQDLPGATAARALIIQRSVKYLDRISAAAPGNSALQLEAAEGYMRLGDVQGKPGNANLGKYAAARESYQKAVALLQQPVRDPAIDRRRSRLLARALIRVGGYPETLQALQILEALRKADAHDSTTLTDLATGNGAMSDLLRQKRELQQALEFRLMEWTLRKQILDADARNLTSTRNFALSSKRMGGLLWAMNRGPEGMDYYRMALRLEEQWAALDPASADARTAISYSHSDIGFLLAGDQKFAEALAHYRKTVSIREELAALDPNNARATLGLASAYWRTAGVSISAGNIQNALELLNKAIKTLSQAKNPDPSSNRSRTELAHIYHVYGESHAGLGDTVAAREWYGRSRQILDGFRAAGTLDVDGADLLKDVEKQLKSSKLR